jgi:hypothetical protein
MRRLRWAAAAVVLAVAGCGGAQAPVTRDAVAVADTVTTAGTLTGPTGSVKGVSYARLTDAYTGNYSGSVATVSPQWQHAVLLSDTTGACGRSGAGEPYAPNEVTLRFTLVGYDNTAGQLPPVQPPAADLPLSFPATGTWVTTSDGVQRQLKAYAMKAKSNGAAGSDLAATGGTVTFTRMDPGPGSYEGSYDVRFGRGRVTGRFSAPWC